MLQPFWRIERDQVWYGDHDVLGAYVREAPRVFELVDRVEDADVAVLPSTLHRYVTDGAVDRAVGFARDAAAAGKRVVVFNERDLDFDPPFRNAILFSPALEGRRGRRAVFSAPAWVPDQFGGTSTERPITARPRIGFCGWTPRPDLKGRVKQFVDMVPPRSVKRLEGLRAPRAPGARHRYLRFRAVDALRAHDGVDADFVLRTGFFAGARQVEAGRETWVRQTLDEAGRDFVRNVLDNDYTLCVRGLGNYSFRFYEVLAAGRIPLFVDTDCVLPYDFEVDWRALFPTVPASRIDGIGDAVVDFHRGQDPEALHERMRLCRQMWERWCSPLGFFENLHLHLRHLKRHGSSAAGSP